MPAARRTVLTLAALALAAGRPRRRSRVFDVAAGEGDFDLGDVVLERVP